MINRTKQDREYELMTWAYENVQIDTFDKDEYAVKHFHELINKQIETKHKIDKVKCYINKIRLMDDNEQLTTLIRYNIRLSEYLQLIEEYIRLAENNEIFKLTHPPRCIYDYMTKITA